jgi:fermentation-respiration switch protein FrsA (DUF1100 family)
MTSVAWILLRVLRIATLSYVGVFVVLSFLENMFVYRPATSKRDWRDGDFAPHECEDVTLTIKDGIRVHGWWLPKANSTNALLYLHGNAGNLSHRGGTIRKSRDYLDTSVLIIDYPGYGKSEGSPSESGCYQAADAAYDWLTSERKIDPRRITIYGGSLGGGVAIDLASRCEHRALMLAKTFTSLPDIGARQFPFLPVRWFMRNRFDNADKIARCRKPIFIAHGDADRLIPFEHGKKLYELATAPKHFMVLHGQDHNDSLPKEFFDEFAAFLKAVEK